MLSAQAPSAPAGTTHNGVTALALCDLPPVGPDYGHAPTFPFTMPPGAAATVDFSESGERCSVRRVDGTLYVRTVSDALGRLVMTEYFDGRGSLYQETINEYAEEDFGTADREPCSSSSWQARSQEWAFLPIQWYFNVGSILYGLNKDTTVTAARSAHAEWETNDNKCLYPDQSSIDYGYQGPTSLTVARDYQSIVDFGELTLVGCSSTAIACALGWHNSAGQRNEHDIRLDDDSGWTNRPDLDLDLFDVWNLMAHEVGHRSLFLDITDDWQVMFHGHRRDDTYKRRLSQGDAIGNNTKW